MDSFHRGGRFSQLYRDILFNVYNEPLINDTNNFVKTNFSQIMNLCLFCCVETLIKQISVSWLGNYRLWEGISVENICFRGN